MPAVNGPLHLGDAIVLYARVERVKGANVPSVIGLLLPEALAAVETAGLVPVIEQREKTGDSSKADRVAWQGPDAGSEVPAGSKVSLKVYVVSISGMLVPNLIGQPIDVAFGLVAPKGSNSEDRLFLDPVIEGDAPTLNDVGIVRRQYPEPGIEIPRGTAIRVWIYGKYVKATRPKGDGNSETTADSGWGERTHEDVSSKPRESEEAEDSDPSQDARREAARQRALSNPAGEAYVPAPQKGKGRPGNARCPDGGDTADAPETEQRFRNPGHRSRRALWHEGRPWPDAVRRRYRRSGAKTSWFGSGPIRGDLFPMRCAIGGGQTHRAGVIERQQPVPCRPQPERTQADWLRNSGSWPSQSSELLPASGCGVLVMASGWRKSAFSPVCLCLLLAVSLFSCAAPPRQAKRYSTKSDISLKKRNDLSDARERQLRDAFVGREFVFRPFGMNTPLSTPIPTSIGMPLPEFWRPRDGSRAVRSPLRPTPERPPESPPCGCGAAAR